MAWIFLAESEDSLKPWKGTSNQSPIVKTTDTLNVFCFQEWQRLNCHAHPYGTTSGLCEPECYQELPMSFMAASPAKTLALPAAEQVWQESEAAYSLRSQGSSAKYDRASSSWRTSQRLLFEDQSELLASFAASGMTRDGVFYPLRMWARITDENDGGYWRTPDTGAGGTSGLLKQGKTHRKSGAAITMRLVDQVNNPKMWPTPLVSDGEKMGHGNLDHTVRMWPTPTTQDAKNNGAASQMERNTKPLNAEVGGSLNPVFVEWLMGYPKNWTVIEDWAERKK